MKGFSQVFSFTCKRIMDGKHFKSASIIVALLLFLVPAVLLPLIERNRPDPDAGEGNGAGIEIHSDEPDPSLIKIIFYAAETDDGYAWTSLETLGTMNLHRRADAKAALAAAEEYGEGAYVLLIREENGRYRVSALMPDEAETKELNTASVLAASFAESLPVYLLHEQYAPDPVPADKLEAMIRPIETVYPEGGEEGDANTEILRDAAGFILPYVNIMLIYFLVLFYGNTVANHVILEKTSKLMDTFLISVKPKAMVMGKVLAAWCTSLLQLGLWIAALVGGCSLGAHLARSIHPNSTMGILRFFGYLGTVMNFYSPVRIVIALLIIVAGFLLYCSLAGVAGSFASKPEELASAMQIFQLVLVVSYLAVLLLSLRNFTSAPSTTLEWYDLVPFTSILITPVRLLMGIVPIWAGLVSLALTAALALLFTYLAGKIYSMMSLYKGNVPKLGEMVRIIFSKA